MILDQLDLAERYFGIHPLFRDAFEYLRATDFADVSSGKHEILGDDLFVIVDRTTGKGKENAMIEYHRKYIDIQYLIAGTDVMGWRATESCERPIDPFDSEKDLGFFFDRPESWFVVPPKWFAVYFPSDGHAPLGCDGDVVKAVLKIRVS